MSRGLERDGRLPESGCYILAALTEPLHGCGIMQRVREISAGDVIIGPGTLYAAITMLLEQGFIRGGIGPEDSRGKKRTPAAMSAVRRGRSTPG